jgi:hypothetical protein
MSLVSFGVPFENCVTSHCFYYPFPAFALSKISSHGAIPFVDWASASFPMHISEPLFSNSAIASGRYDRYITQFARASKRYGKPFFLRLDWEMNGDWEPWDQPQHGVPVNGNTPTAFVNMWRHVHRLFTLAGATNVRWVWCPNIDPQHYWVSMARLYPGNGYVDWTCLDGYNWGTTGPGSLGAQRGGWQTFNALFWSSYQNIVGHIAPTKPMILGEVASSPHGGSEATWISNMFHLLATRYLAVHGFLWYSVVDSWTFPFQPKSPTAAAFAAGLRGGRYASNVSKCLTGDVIPTVFAARARKQCTS